MALKLSVKIGDVTNLSDARYAAGMGVDFIGFNIDANSENGVTPKAFKEIVNWISGVGIIGEIGAQLPDNQEEYPPYLIETNNPAIITPTTDFIFRINARELSLPAIEKLMLDNKGAFFFVLELNKNQIEADFSSYAKLCALHPIYINTDFTEQLLEKVVSTINPKGIEIKGSLEDQPGFKDYDGIADVLEWLEEE